MERNPERGHRSQGPAAVSGRNSLSEAEVQMLSLPSLSGRGAGETLTVSLGRTAVPAPAGLPAKACELCAELWRETCPWTKIE